ncbi:acyltransferase [Thalassotalea loyana]|uniref:Acyltransferase n=1 Tax=Thalassotalea loyana TaxID=280483 RepID=A0ABQ6HBZ5_9GAMM|nr:acyltransferase [Thalassotalea loyana]GLX85628.1 acyltransferase [Thalassotalea loyana]
MFSFLPRFICFPFTFTLFCLNLAFCGFLVFLGGFLKFIIPLKAFHRVLYKPMHFFYRLWSLNNYLIIRLFNNVEWRVVGDQDLNKKSWYLLIANHQSWLDIFVIAHFARTRIPEPKFFLKESLRYIPFLGMACWALDMPFMRRYKKSFIAKNPHLKGKDIETTKASCQQFKNKPTTIVNFVEGTRFTEEKHHRQGSRFDHLLTPKAGGIAFTLAAMGEQFDKVLNITLAYPDNRGHIMMDMLCGDLKTIIVYVDTLEVNDNVVGDYYNDKSYRVRFQRWLNETWSTKDKLLAKYLT